MDPAAGLKALLNEDITVEKFLAEVTEVPQKFFCLILLCCSIMRKNHCIYSGERMGKATTAMFVCSTDGHTYHSNMYKAVF